MRKGALLLSLGAASILAAGAVGRKSYREVLKRDAARERAEAEQDRKWLEDKYRRQGWEPGPTQWKQQHPPVLHRLRSLDGISLAAEEYAPQGESHRWFITVHGYRTFADGMLPFVQLFYQQEGHVLVPHLRGHGKSGGEAVTMGGTDRLDLLQWIDWIVCRDPLAEIVLHGVSMGAATVMMTAGETLPPQVRCVIEDCGYSDAWTELRIWMEKHDLPAPGLVLRCMDRVAGRKAGIALRAICPERQLRRCKIPLMVIHGQEDAVVPLYMAGKIFAAHPGEKEYWAVPGAGHADAYFTAPKEYAARVQSFFSRYLSQEEL